MFYEYLKEINPMERNLLLTVLTGKEKGEQALLSGEKILACTEHWPETLTAWAEAAYKTEAVCEPEAACKPEAVDKAETAGKAAGITEACGYNVFAEEIGSRKRLILSGAGHVALCVLRMAAMLGFETYVVEDRPSFGNEAKEVGADHVLIGAFSRELERIPCDGENYYVVMTRGHRYDLDCLRVILPRNAVYTGMMSSRKRAAEVRKQLLSEGFSEEALERIHAPIGLQIGAETPEEIAVSVMAEIISVMRKAGGHSIPKEILAALLEAGEERILAEIVERRGSAPRNAGTKMVVYADGRIAGTIGGGCFEAEVIRRARQMMTLREEPCLMEVDLSGLSSPDLEGVACGGIMEVFLKRLD